MPVLGRANVELCTCELRPDRFYFPISPMCPRWCRQCHAYIWMSPSTVIGPDGGMVRGTERTGPVSATRARASDVMNPVEDAERDGGVGGFAVGSSAQSCSSYVLMVGVVFGQRQLDARVGVQMAVGHVMHDLPAVQPPSRYGVSRPPAGSAPSAARHVARQRCRAERSSRAAWRRSRQDRARTCRPDIECP